MHKQNKRMSLWKEISLTSNLHNELFSSSTCLFLYNRSLCGWQCTCSCYNALGENHNSARQGPTSLPSLTGAWQPLCPGHAAVASPLLLQHLTLFSPAAGQPRVACKDLYTHLLLKILRHFNLTAFCFQAVLYNLLSNSFNSFFRFYICVKYKRWVVSLLFSPLLFYSLAWIFTSKSIKIKSKTFHFLFSYTFHPCICFLTDFSLMLLIFPLSPHFPW